MHQGFSLVELSIVLVILGLLTGGILAGQSLIRASELRAVTNELHRYQAATQTYRDKYQALPGDHRDATRFFARSVNAAHCASNSAAAVGTPGVCDGDGDGNIELGSSTASTSGEIFQYWRQLALAGLIEGTFTGLNGGDADTTIIGTNVPASRVNSGGWTMQYGNFTSGGSLLDADFNQNMFVIGAQTLSEPTSAPILKPEEAWNIDTKIDDGKPGTGRVYGGRWAPCTTATASTQTSSDYRLTSSSIACMLIFMPVF